MAFATITIGSAIIELPWGDLLGFRTRLWPLVFLNTFCPSPFPAAAAPANEHARTHTGIHRYIYHLFVHLPIEESINHVYVRSTLVLYPGTTQLLSLPGVELRYL